MKSVFEFRDPVEFLRFVFAEEKSRYQNRSYSLRNWSRKIGMSPATISRIFCGRRRITPRLARKIAGNLSLSPNESAYFQILTARELFAGSGGLDELAGHLQARAPQGRPMLPLEISKFELVSEWYYGALLELMKCEYFDGSAAYLNSRLSPSLDEASLNAAMENLVALGFVKVEDGRYALNQEDAKSVKIAPEAASRAVQTFHQQMLSLANRAVESTPFEERDLRGCTLSLSDDNYKRALKILDEAFDKVIGLADPLAPRVMQLNSQLFPLSKAVLRG